VREPRLTGTWNRYAGEAGKILPEFPLSTPPHVVDPIILIPLEVTTTGRVDVAVFWLNSTVAPGRRGFCRLSGRLGSGGVAVAGRFTYAM
jgi:hypothetical protein